MIKYIKRFFKEGDTRSLLMKKNIVASFFFRAVSILVSLMLVPISITYLSKDTYGLWLTISSIISWMAFFDFGFAHGFRNSFAKSVAKDDFVLAKKYVSTAYFVIACIFITLMLITSFVNSFINWPDILNVSPELTTELRIVFQILIFFFCMKNVVDVFLTMMTAYQRPAVSMGIIALGDIVVLLSIYTITLVSHRNLPLLALIMSSVPCCVTLLVSFIVFRKKNYKKFCPNLKSIDISLVKDIVGVGAQFFIIMLSMLFIFQLTNIIITRELGTSSVTLYNVTYKLFNIMIVVMTILLTPMWSAFTDAYTRNDYAWMKKCINRIEKIGLLTIPVIILLLISSEFIFDIWLGDKVETNIYLTAVMSLFAICRIMGQAYMYPLNGIGKIRLQLITYLLFALIAIPGIVYCTRAWGIIGTMIIPTVTFLVQCIVNRIQLMKIINKKATGIWNK